MSKKTSQTRQGFLPISTIVAFFAVMLLAPSWSLPVLPHSGETVRTGNCLLSAPTGFETTVNSATSIALNWNQVTDAVAYRLIVHKLDSDEVVSDAVVYGASAVLSGLQTGTSYRCVLAAMCGLSSTSSFIITSDIVL